ncbi:MAG TPA: DUF4350 domain-containing protein [Chloroflexota bacterium]|nr:DUF4350 domain-containing protein [Chloroflexota bacterium]
MRSHLRTAAIVLGVFALLFVLTWIGYRPNEDNLPYGSSRSSSATGTRALFLWYEALGARAQRLDTLPPQIVMPPGRTDMLFVVQPLLPILPPSRPQFEQVLDRGGTLVLAGTTLSLEAIAPTSDVRLSLSETLHHSATTPDGSLRVPVDTRMQVELDQNLMSRAQPLLVTSNGALIAARLPHRGGSLIVSSSARPFTNQGLRDADTARFIYREFVAPLPEGAVVAFEESLRPTQSVTDENASLGGRVLDWVLSTSLGAAAAYAGVLVFIYLLLSGRHLGPPLRPVEAGGSSRTMYEHVQALAGLYRRSGQLAHVRAQYEQHYRRLIARAYGADAVPPEGFPIATSNLIPHGVPPQLAEQLSQAIERIDRARSERQLAEAITAAEAVFADLPHSVMSG